MKKNLLTWFAACWLFVGVSAQDTIDNSNARHRFFSGIDRVEVTGNSRLHVIYGSQASDSVIVLKVTSAMPFKEADVCKVTTKNTVDSKKTAQTGKQVVEKTNPKKVLELTADNVDYELSLNKDNVEICGENNAQITYATKMKKISPLSVRLEDNASFRFLPTAQQEEFTIQRLDVTVADHARFVENMPLEMDVLNVSRKDQGQYVVYEDETGRRKVKSATLEAEDASVYALDSLVRGQGDDTLSNFMRSWNELGLVIEEAIKTNDVAVSQRPNYWHNKWELYWGFLGWQGDASAFLPYLQYAESSDMHISFSSFTWEIKECYRFKYRHELSFGLGVSWDNYRLPTPDNNQIANIAGDSLNSTFKKGKARVGYVQIPVGYTYERKKGGFNFSLEMIAGYAMKSICKTEWNSSESKYIFKQGIKDKVEPWKLDARLTLGWSWGSIFVQPSLLPVITDNGKSIYPVRAGFRFKL